MFKLLNRLRRNFMQLTKKDYIINKMKKRKGYCKKCGQCCKGCNYLDKKTNFCKVYNKRPFYCHKQFPIDNLDQKVFRVKNCGYSFS